MRLLMTILVGFAVLVFVLHSQDETERWSRNAECRGDGGTVVRSRWWPVMFDDCRHR